MFCTAGAIKREQCANRRPFKRPTGRPVGQIHVKELVEERRVGQIDLLLCVSPLSCLFSLLSALGSFGNLKLAGERLGLSYDAFGYWDLHIREDERHGRWMLDDVTLPLIAKYKDAAWQMVLGYDEQKNFNSRAGKAVLCSVKEAEQC